MGGSFVIPGALGDGPELADLRRALQPHVDMELVELPTSGVRGAVLVSMAETSKTIADEIERRCPSGPVGLAGYSFGGSACLEVAAQLTRRGRGIAWMVVLDGPFEVEELSGGYAELRRATSIKAAIGRATVDLAGAVDETRWTVMAMASPAIVGEQRSQMVHRGLLTHMRNKALKSWAPPRCDAPGLHIYTGGYGDANLARWAELCPNLRQVRVETDHEDLLKGDAFHAVKDEIVAFMGQSRP